MAELLHNFQSFNAEVKVEVEQTPPVPPLKGRPAVKPTKTVKSLYEMIDGKLPDRPKTPTPRPAAKRPGCVGLMDAVREALAFLVSRP